MGNICPTLSPPSSGPTERSGLIANQHSAPIRPQQPRDHQTYQVPARQRDPSEHHYTAKSIDNRRSKISEDSDLNFSRIGLENLDKRLNDISTLYNNLLERYSNLKTGLIQLDQIAKELCAKSYSHFDVGSGNEDPICSAFSCFARQMVQTADTENPVSVKLKEHAKHWNEALFDSRHLQYDQISFLNLYNQLGRYAWELRSKTPPLRGTVAMTTQEEETFRRDLLVASLNSESNAFSANFVRLRRVDEQLGGFERLGTEAGERLAEAGRRLLLSE